MRTRLLATIAAICLLVGACADDDSDAGTTPDPTDPPAGVIDTDDGDAGAATDDDAPGGETAVVEVTMSFDPGTVEIEAGDSVRWDNASGVPHTVTSTSGPTEFDESLPDGSSVTFTFDQPGTYEYVCSIHPSMTGTVVVS